MWTSVRELDAIGTPDMSYEEKFRVLVERKRNGEKIQIKTVTDNTCRDSKHHKVTITANEAFEQQMDLVDETVVELLATYGKYKKYIDLDKEELKSRVTLYMLELLNKWGAEGRLTTTNKITIRLNLKWAFECRPDILLGVKKRKIRDLEYLDKYRENNDRYENSGLIYTDITGGRVFEGYCDRGYSEELKEVEYRLPISIDLIDENSLALDDKTDEELDKYFLSREIDEQLKTLTDREVYVLKERFGLGGGRPKGLDEVARNITRADGTRKGVNRERVRQIEAKALRKFRHPSRSKALKTF